MESAMKLVFTTEEVAAALGKTPQEFASIREELEKLGFPKPVPGLQHSWSIMNVINWVNTSTPPQTTPA
jgi:hypothetical protein